MLYKKSERRIDQIIGYLEERRLTETDTKSSWFTAETTLEYGDIPPSEEELSWAQIDEFPYYYGKEWTNF